MDNNELEEAGTPFEYLMRQYRKLAVLQPSGLLQLKSQSVIEYCIVYSSSDVETPETVDASLNCMDLWKVVTIDWGFICSTLRVDISDAITLHTRCAEQRLIYPDGKVNSSARPFVERFMSQI